MFRRHHEEKAPTADEKREKYEQVLADCKTYFEKYNSTLNKLSFESKMVITSAAISSYFNDLIFCGYYVVKYLLDGEGKPLDRHVLEIGPYQSHVLATPRIDLGKGVCGQCWEEKQTQIVEDVATCKNYIACDGKTQSEIVLPVFKSRGDTSEVIAVLDIDSGTKARFDKVDQEFLEKVVDYLYE